MDALLTALGCSLMMLVLMGAFAWYSRRSAQAGEADEVAALRAEIAELPSDELAGRG
jgi:uncharacterized iron-regulated membrane protein